MFLYEKFQFMMHNSVFNPKHNKTFLQNLQDKISQDQKSFKVKFLYETVFSYLKFLTTPFRFFISILEISLDKFFGYQCIWQLGRVEVFDKARSHTRRVWFHIISLFLLKFNFFRDLKRNVYFYKMGENFTHKIIFWIS